MSADKMREDFEAKFRELSTDANLSIFSEGGYVFEPAKTAWLCYQDASAKSTAKLGGDINMYLKDGETVVQRLERDRLEVITTLDMLAKERGIVEKQAAKIAQMKATIDELVEALTEIRGNHKLWKSGGRGGADMYQSLPPAMRIIDEALAKVNKDDVK